MGFVLGLCIEGGGRRARRGLLLVGAAGVATLLALPATAAAQTTDDPSAVDQYVEDVPTGGGSSVPGSGGKPKNTNLPPGVTAQIADQGGDDADLLNQVASSSDYGAPQKTLKRKTEKSGYTISGAQMERREGGGSAGGAEEDVSAASAVSSAIAADGAGATRLVGLLVLLFAISLGALAFSAIRHRRRTPTAAA
jgi:hypothetical protein